MKNWQSVALALCCLTLALFIGGANVAMAQEVTATVSGTVTDQSGAAVVGAVVTAKSVERGTTYTGQTNDSGIYRIPTLPIGKYDLRIEKTGFQASLYPELVLHENQIARIDVELKVGQVSQTIEVTGAAPVLKTEATQVDTIINAATNDNLPLASRNYVQLTLLAPGSVTTDPGSFTSGSNTTSYGSRPLINGNREQANNFLLDGMDNNQVSDNLLGYTPAPDAIQEFNLITNNAPAEFGNFMGGIVSATIKSGTNSFHGDVWDYLRNDALNANSWSNNFNTTDGVWDPLAKAKLRWNMFGGTLGGPIIKNKLFFFVDYQGQRYDIPASPSAFTVFTANERQGDFSGLCKAGFDSTGVCTQSGSGNVQLYNPCQPGTGFGGVTCVAATTRTPFAYNLICGQAATAPGQACGSAFSMVSQVAANLFASSLYPQPIGTGLQQNAFNSNSQQFNYDQGDIKIDWRPNDKDSVSYRFTRSYQVNPSSYTYALYGDSSAVVPIYNTVGDWTRMVSANLVNDVRFGWSHVTFNTEPSWQTSVGQFGNTLGIGNGNPPGIDGALALEFHNSLISNIGQRVTTENFDDHVWQAEDSVTWTHGRHTLKMGGQFFHEIIKTYYAGNNGQLGYMGFDGRFTSNTIGAFATGAGDGAADFFLGFPESFGRGIPSNVASPWEQSTNVFALYGQDTWRVNEKLTLNLGLRYEFHTPWIETNDQQANYNMATGIIDYANQNGASRALYNGFYGARDLQPRIGFAYTPGGFLGAKTVIRGAFTISSYLEGTGTNLRLPFNPPFLPAERNTQYNNLALPLTNTTDGIQGSASQDCSAPAYACYSQYLFRVWDPNVQPAIDNQWNLTVQHQFWGDTTFQLGYVGQHAYHLMVPFDYAQRVLNADGSTAPSPFFAANPALYGVLGNPAQGGLGATVSGTQSNGTMSYNALQAVVQKEMSHGLQYQVAYTYSKCMSDSTGYYGAWNNALSASAYWQNVYDQKAEWAPCYYDATHVLTAYAVYELPFGKGKAYGHDVNRAVDAVIGGWQVSPIFTFRTGWPMPVQSAVDESGTFGRGARADCNSLPSIQNTPISGAGGIQWFTNNNNFVNPDPGTFGNCAPQLGGLRGPHYTNLDLGLAKNFSLTERFRLQFRTDFINAFNHVQYNAPNMGLGSGMGQITTAQAPRNIQFALKLYY